MGAATPGADGAAPRVLSGVRVIDVGTWIAGPAAATVMSDFGADVIKIEPPGGDSYREFYHFPGAPRSEANYGWLLDSRNKKSAVLDLNVPAGREALLALVATADVFITNHLPARMARLRIGYEELAAVNPRLVYASLTAYGEVGAEADKTGFDVNAWWARSGLMDVVRAPGAPVTGSAAGMGDHPTSIALFGAIMMALYQRERTGRGAKVSTSLLAGGAWANGLLLQAALCGAVFTPRRPRDRALNPLANLYQSRDGQWFLLTLVREERDWERLARAVDRQDLLADARFTTVALRRENSPALIALLDEVFASRDWAEWRGILLSNQLLSSHVARLADVIHDPQMAATEAIVPFEASGYPGMRTIMSPIQMAGEPKVAPGRPPDVGEHTVEVLRSAGYDDAGIARLRAAGALG